MPALNATSRTQRAILALTLGLGLTWLSQQLLLAWWSVPLFRCPGMGMWSWAAYGLGACLALVAVTPEPTQPRVRDAVFLLMCLSLLGAGLGSVLPGIDLLLMEAERAPPGRELLVIITDLQRLYGPLAMFFTALPGALLVRLALHEDRSGRLPAALVLGWAVIAVAGLAARAYGWSRGVDLILSGMDPAVPGALCVDWLWQVPALLLAAGVAWLLSRRRSWLACAAWVAAQLVLVDPVPLASARMYDGVPPRGASPEVLGIGLASPLPLLDLTLEPPHYDGEDWSGPLVARLQAADFHDLGRDNLLTKFPPEAWEPQLQRAVHMAPPRGATVGDLVPAMTLLRRFGVTIWLWPGESSQRVDRTVRRAFERPVVSVLTYPPPLDRHPEFCAELSLGPESAGLAGVRPDMWPLPKQLDIVKEVPFCGESSLATVVVTPTADVPLDLLHAVLDRLGGTHPEARYRYRVALRWPGLDDAWKGEAPR